MLKVYTDGSCLGNPGAGGYAVDICNEDDDVKTTIRGGEKDTTNNRMELMAIIEALKFLEEHTLGPCIIYSDSQWAIHATEKTWKIKKNLDMVKIAQTLYRDLSPQHIKLSWLPGHAGFLPNERVNSAAQEEANKWT